MMKIIQDLKLNLLHKLSLNNIICAVKMLIYLKYISILIMSIFYINVGMKHFTDPIWFTHIIPPILSKFDLFLVYLSGYFEIAFGMMLLFLCLEKLLLMD